MSAAPDTAWPDAAASLARRVERRARVGAWASALGGGLAAGAGAALAARLAGHASWAVPLLVAGGLVGLAVGALRARRIARVQPGDAAWALDRLAGAHEQGLTAALLGADRARAVDRLPPAPPTVALRPPAGLSLLAGGGVLAALVLVVGTSSAADAPAPPGEGAERVVGRIAGPAPADGEPSAARPTEQRALAAERVRRALGLSAAESEDPAAVAERLNDPEARAAARAAAGPDNALTEALAGERPSGEAVATGLRSGARAADELETRRRTELAREATLDGPPLPPAQRALVERYFVLRTRGAR